MCFGGWEKSVGELCETHTHTHIHTFISQACRWTTLCSFPRISCCSITRRTTREQRSTISTTASSTHTTRCRCSTHCWRSWRRTGACCGYRAARWRTTRTTTYTCTGCSTVCGGAGPRTRSSSARASATRSSSTGTRRPTSRCSTARSCPAPARCTPRPGSSARPRTCATTLTTFARSPTTTLLWTSRAPRRPPSSTAASTSAPR